MFLEGEAEAFLPRTCSKQRQ